MTIQSDHKPLEAIVKKPLQNTPPPLQMMLLSLQKYDIDLVYLAGKENILADTLTCAYLEETTDDIPEEELTAQVHMVYENAPEMKSRFEEIKEETAKDPGLKKVTKCIIEGWPNSKDNISIMKQNHIGHLEKNYQSLMELYLKVKDWLYLKL